MSIKGVISKVIFILFDVATIALSIYLAFELRESLTSLENIHTIPLETYMSFYPLYLIVLLLFFYEGIYTYRYDFWHESRIVLKVLIVSAILVFAYLAMTKSVESYSRLVIGLAFVFMGLLIPVEKNILKKLLFSLGLWRKKAEIYGNDPFLTEEIYSNSYLGYVKPKESESPSTLFINPNGDNPKKLKELLATEMKQNHEVIFIPLMREYDLTQSHIYELSNTRTNLIVYQNRLKSWYRRAIRQLFNYLFALLLLPVMLPLLALFALLIKSESKGSVIFTHYRVGKNGKMIPTYKFRSMYEDANGRLEKLLASDENLKREWESCFKLKDDPRITKVGRFLRSTSLDELPQIFNVLKGQMHFVGPRPVTQEELELYYKEDSEYYCMVKPGITGLWQVSGRSDTDYEFRVETDKWYVLNWSIWLDIVILLKTVKVVLKRDGAY